MAVSTPFFGKRDPEPSRAPAPSNGLNSSKPPVMPSSGGLLASPITAPNAPPTAAAASVPGEADTAGTGSKLTVGPNIKLKGVEITDCDTLVVEGTVEATMHSRVIQIAAQGAFKGEAEIDIAEIHGHFDGVLTVRQKLVVHGTGRVSGQIRYGKLVVEEGGQLSGEIRTVSESPATAAAVARRNESSGGTASPVAMAAAHQA